MLLDLKMKRLYLRLMIEKPSVEKQRSGNHQTSIKQENIYEAGN